MKPVLQMDPNPLRLVGAPCCAACRRAGRLEFVDDAKGKKRERMVVRDHNIAAALDGERSYTGRLVRREKAA